MQRRSEGWTVLLLLACVGAVPGRAAELARGQPARIVSPTLHGDIVTLSEAEAGMFDPARIWTMPVHFEHPMTVTTPRDLAKVKAWIEQRREPQFTAWLALQRDAAIALRFVPRPPGQLLIMGGYEAGNNLESARDVLWGSASSAYACALLWALTSEAKYADQSVEILRAWAQADTVFTGKDRGLQLGSHFTAMLYAADLLHGHPGWKQTDRDAFEAFWRRRVLPHTKFVMLRNNNWGDNALMGVLAAGIVFEDEFLVRRCLYQLNDYFFGNWKIRKDDRGTFLLDEVERNQGRSGITYTAYALQAITQVLEMARSFGPELDWWRRRTTADASMRELCEWFFRWNILKEPFLWYDENFREGEPAHSTGSHNTLETAHTRLPDLDSRIGEWLARNRPVDGAEGDPYVTLLKGTP